MTQLSGRIGGVYQVYDLKAEWNGQTLRGRIGGVYEGKDVALSVAGAPTLPPELAVVAALCAYRQLEDDQDASASAAGSSS